jgi:tripeptide aminopeptidase
MLQPATASVADLARSSGIRPALEWFRKERAWINEQHLKLCRIPAPTFFEQKRAEWIAESFRSLGWSVKIDRAGNVVASLAASSKDSTVAVTAHLDTVLSPRAPEDIKISGDGRMLGPGVSDNGAGLAGLLALAACWNAVGVLGNARPAPVLVANVGEEGEGNLCGMRYVCRATSSRPRAFLVLDGPGTERITSRALACRRFDITVTGPGGHSWSDHGVANPVHMLSRAITLFNDGMLSSNAAPRCSYNFGLIQGGNSINSIPTEARAKVDLRSENRERMEEMAALLASVVDEALSGENLRATGGRVTARVREIGSRPGGALPEGAAILGCLQAVDEYLGIRAGLDCSSTDANIPLSLGLPALSVGAGGQGGGAHTPAEWYQPEGRDLGLRRILLTLCLLLDGAGNGGALANLNRAAD